MSAPLSFFVSLSLSLSLSLSVLSRLFTRFPLFLLSLHVPQESVKEKALVASTSLATLAVTSPAFAYDLFSAENAGAIKVWTLGLFVGLSGLTAIFLPFVCGTINPIQMAINLGLVEGEVSNLRKFKRNGETDGTRHQVRSQVVRYQRLCEWQGYRFCVHEQNEAGAREERINNAVLLSREYYYSLAIKVVIVTR